LISAISQLGFTATFAEHLGHFFTLGWREEGTLLTLWTTCSMAQLLRFLTFQTQCFHWQSVLVDSHGHTLYFATAGTAPPWKSLTLSL
jgi:hypothetical protein